MKIRMPMVIIPLIISAITAWPFDGRAEEGRVFHLNLSGDQATIFEGTCLAAKGDIDVTLELKGQPPHEASVVGDRLGCKITADGHLVVDIDDGGSRTRSTTTGGNITLRLD